VLLFDKNVVSMDEKMLHCASLVAERAVLLVVDDWWLTDRVDTSLLLRLAAVVEDGGVSLVRLACWDRAKLPYGGMATRWPGLFVFFDSPLVPTIWETETLKAVLSRTVAWTPQTNKTSPHCARRKACLSDDPPPYSGRQRVESFSRSAYAWRSEWAQGAHDLAYPDDGKAVLVASGPPLCEPGMGQLPGAFPWVNAVLHGALRDKRVGRQVFCAMSPLAQEYVRDVLSEMRYASKHHYFPNACPPDARNRTAAARARQPERFFTRRPCCGGAAPLRHGGAETLSNSPPDCEPPAWSASTKLAWSLDVDVPKLRAATGSECCWAARPVGHMYATSGAQTAVCAWQPAFASAPSVTATTGLGPAPAPGPAAPASTTRGYGGTGA